MRRKSQFADSTHYMWLMMPDGDITGVEGKNKNLKMYFICFGFVFVPKSEKIHGPTKNKHIILSSTK